MQNTKLSNTPQGDQEPTTGSSQTSTPQKTGLTHTSYHISNISNSYWLDFRLWLILTVGFLLLFLESLNAYMFQESSIWLETVFRTFIRSFIRQIFQDGLTIWFGSSYILLILSRTTLIGGIFIVLSGQQTVSSSPH